MEIESAFKNNERIPDRYSYNKENLSPYLKIKNLPKETKTIAIISHDPDASNGEWVHWVVWNISPIKEIKEGAKVGTEGINDFGNTGYDGPSPPPGKMHRYFFEVYALDSEINLKQGSSKKEVENAIHNHIMASAVLAGVYSR